MSYVLYKFFRFLGHFFILLGISMLLQIPYSNFLSAILFAGIFFYLSTKCYRAARRLITPSSNPAEEDPRDTRGEYEGRTHGEVIDLGRGSLFDARNPDAIADGVNWIPDGRGGYHSPTGESIEYNYITNSYDYKSPSDDDSY